MSGNPTEHNETAAGDARQRMTAEAVDAARDLRDHGEKIAETAKAQAQSFAAEQKEAGAKQVGTVARAVGKAADELENASPELARYTREMASKVEGVSEALRSRSVGDLFQDANRFARREPAVFFGAAVAAGFALSRFLESSARNSQSSSAGSTRDTGERSTAQETFNE